MSDYTPTTECMKRVYSYAPANFNVCDHLNPTPAYAGEQFDRWLEAHDREIKAEALQEAAEDFGDTTWADVLSHITSDVEGVQAFAAWLRNRAQRIKEES